MLGIVSLRLNIAFYAPLMIMIVAVIVAVIVSVIRAGFTTLAAIKIRVVITMRPYCIYAHTKNIALVPDSNT